MFLFSQSSDPKFTLSLALEHNILSNLVNLGVGGGHSNCTLVQNLFFFFFSFCKLDFSPLPFFFLILFYAELYQEGAGKKFLEESKFNKLRKILNLWMILLFLKQCESCFFNRKCLELCHNGVLKKCKSNKLVSLLSNK